MVRGRAASRGEFTDIHGELTAGDTAAIRRDMQHQRYLEVLCRPPETLVDGVPVGPIRQRIHRDERPHQPQPDTALELLAGSVSRDR